MQYLFLFLIFLGTTQPPHYHQFSLDPKKDHHHYILEEPEETNLRNFYFYLHAGKVEIHGVTAKLRDGASIYFAVGQSLIKDQYTSSFRVHGQAIQSLIIDYEVPSGSPKVALELLGSEN